MITDTCFDIMKIRAYEPRDKEALRNICSKTAPSFDTDKKRDALFAAYLDYYIDSEGEYCFVAVNEADIPIGYVISAPDYDRYNARFFSKELPYSGKLFRSDPRIWLSLKATAIFVRKLKKRYPAHLHIDILPEGQRMGIGTALVDRLREKLRSEGIPGVFLICGAKNEKGVNFYRKYGFKEIKKLPGSIIFATET